MATTINASTSGLIETSDGTDVLDLQTGGTTALRVNAAQAIGVGSSPSFGTAGQFLTSQGNAASPTWTSGGSGTVTSVGWIGGIVSIATATTTPAFTIAGTSGGIPYFSSASTWASSAALTQYGIVYGGGAGAAPVATAAGTTGQFLGANTGAAPTWQTPAGGSPGGSTTQVQYNNGGAFGGISGFTTDGTRVTASTTIGVGGATPSTSGSGVTFPATQSASSDVNTLDDYEEGTWTPSIGGSATYNSRWGSYTKVGRVVTCQFWISVNAIGSGSATTITGLPFSINNPTYANDISGGPVTYFASSATSVYTLNIRGGAGGASLFFSGTTATSTTINNSVSVFQNSAVVQASIIYETAT
jgi:hypothetical protein